MLMDRNFESEEVQWKTEEIKLFERARKRERENFCGTFFIYK